MDVAASASLVVGASTAWGNTGVFGLVYPPVAACATLPIVIVIEGWLYRRMGVTHAFRVATALNALSAVVGFAMTLVLAPVLAYGGTIYVTRPSDPNMRWALAGNFLISLAIEGGVGRLSPWVRATGLRWPMVARANLWSYAFLAIAYYLPTILAPYLPILRR
jgi:hypothetical protein